MPSVVLPVDEVTEQSDSGYAADGIYVPSLIVYSNKVTFLIKNTYKVNKTVY